MFCPACNHPDCDLEKITLDGVVYDRWINNKGYALIGRIGQPHCFFEHRAVMEDYLGRTLTSEEHIHHKNEIRFDNRLSNLQVLTRGQHSSLHKRGKRFAKSFL